MNIYKKITKFRDEHQNSPDYEMKRNFLEQLLIVSFNNKANPDSLPETFDVNHIYFSEEDLIKTMAELGYTVKLETLLREWNSKFSNFRITIIK